MSEANKAVATRFAECVNAKNFDSLGSIIAPTMVMHDPASSPMPSPGPEGMKAFFGMYVTAFPDIHMETLSMFSEGDRVFAHWLCTGTNNGPMGPMPATGKKVKFEGMEVYRIADGKIADIWVNWDKAGMLQQLGLMPA